MRNYKYTLLLSATITAAPAFAQNAPPPLVAQARASSDTIIVTAGRTPREAWKSGQSVSVIDREEIEDSQDVRATDLLRRVPGIAVSSTGGPGQISSIFVRGADNAQTLVLVDGVRLNDPADVGGGFDYGSMLTGSFNRVEILRGSQSAIWGSQAIGGVINFRTADPGEEWTGRASAEYGARDWINLNGAASGSAGPVGLSFGGQYLDTDGYSAYSEDLGGKEKDGFKGVSLFGKAEMDLTDALSINAGGFYSDNDYDFDASTGDVIGNYGKKRDLTGFTFAEYNDDSINARVGYTLTDTHRLSDSGFGPFVSDGRRELIEAVGTVRLSDMISATVGGESEHSEYQDNYGTDAESGIDSLFGQVNLTLGERLSVNGGVRYDDQDDYGDETSLSASAAYRPFGNGLMVRASYGEGFRAPSLYQLYYNENQGVAVPAPLEPETSKSYDAGIELPFDEDRGVLSATYFHRKTKNLFQYVYVSSGPPTYSALETYYYNVDRAVAEGVEMAFNYSGQGFDVRLSYTYLDAEDESTGLDLPRRPKNNFFAGISYRPIELLQIGADLTHGGGRFDDSSNLTRIGAFTTLDLRASFDVTENFALYGRVENVTDKQYELATNYGQPGRNATVGVKARF